MAIEEEKVVLSVSFCDGSEMLTEHYATAWGRTEARDRYQHYIEMANRNETVLAAFPHVKKVSIILDGQSACEEFGCRCKKKEAVSA